MQRSVVETIMGGVVLVIAVAFLVYVFGQSGLSSSAGGYDVNAEFDDASGIRAGSEVRISGVKVGTVASQSLDPKSYFAEVRMTIRDGVELPTDTSAKISADGLLGGAYISLSPGGSSDNIQAGGTITSTQGALNIVDLIGRFVFGGAGGGDAAKGGAGAPAGGPG